MNLFLKSHIGWSISYVVFLVISIITCIHFLVTEDVKEEGLLIVTTVILSLGTIFFTYKYIYKRIKLDIRRAAIYIDNQENKIKTGNPLNDDPNVIFYTQRKPKYQKDVAK